MEIIITSVAGAIGLLTSIITEIIRRIIRKKQKEETFE